MKLINGSEEYSFSSSSYEDEDLGSLDYEVEVIEDADEIFDAFQGTGSCIEREELADQKAYADTFADSDNVHFYSVGDVGYARAVELPTTEGDALAVDAVKAGEDFDPEVYRAGVNSVMKHADVMDKDLVLGGKEFFKHRWHKTLDLTRDKSAVNPAEDVFFDRTVPEREMKVDYSEKEYTKGEQWDDMEEYFVRWL